jgi:hypothetical protein
MRTWHGGASPLKRGLCKRRRTRWLRRARRCGTTQGSRKGACKWRAEQAGDWPFAKVALGKRSRLILFRATSDGNWPVVQKSTTCPCTPTPWVKGNSRDRKAIRAWCLHLTSAPKLMRIGDAHRSFTARWQILDSRRRSHCHWNRLPLLRSSTWHHSVRSNPYN